MNPKVLILGSGTCVPSVKRSSCAAILDVCGIKILMDCGPGVMRRLAEADIDIHDISYVLVSHFHPDHSGELASFLFSNKYPHSHSRIKPLTLIGGKGFINFLNRLKSVYGNWIELEPEIVSVIELKAESKDIIYFTGFTLESIPTIHNPESVAFKIISPQGHTVIYSGDTDYCPDMIGFAQNADLMICESATPNDMKVRGHLTPSLAGKMAALASVKKLVLTHFYPECDRTDIVSECRKTYSGSLIIAEDLMEIQIDALEI